VDLSISTDCPVCGFEEAKVSDGVSRATKDAMELLSGPDATRWILELLKSLAEQVRSGNFDKAEAIQRANEAAAPKFAELFEVFASLGLTALALLVAIIGVYLQAEGNRSSSEHSK
jgi:hypothetical protein